jgi:two-component system, LuxR family, sensor kinase FixL
MARIPLAHHLGSAGMVALTSFLRVPIEAWGSGGFSPILYIPSITIAARYGGFGSGVVAVVLWGAAWVCLDIPTNGSEKIRSLEEQYRVVIFLLEGMILSGIVEAFNVALRASDETAREVERYRMVSGRNEARLRAILEHSSAPIWMKDLEGRYLIVNRRFESLVRCPAIEVMGRTDTELSLPRIADSLSVSDRLVLDQGRAVEVEEVIPFDDGPRTFLSVKFPLADNGGAPYAIGGILTDITDLKKAQARAVQVERLAAIGQMVTGLAHESRNALQRSQACLEMLRFRLEGNAEAIDLLTGVQDAQDDLHRLYEEVRCYAAPLNIARQPCRLRSLLAEAWGQLAWTQRGRDAGIVESGAGDDRCLADSRRIVQVFRNLLDNSLAACQDPVRVAIEWSDVRLEGREAIRVALRDNGPGFSSAQKHTLFEPFQTTKAQGTGLGMAISRRIVEAHDGTIAAGGFGRPGAEVILILPRGDT